MSAKAKTTIAIKQPVYDAAKRLAEAEDRDFSFVVERALLGELRAAGVEVGNAPDPRAELLAAAEDIGMDAAIAAVRREARKKKHAA